MTGLGERGVEVSVALDGPGACLLLALLLLLPATDGHELSLCRAP